MRPKRAPSNLWFLFIAVISILLVARVYMTSTREILGESSGFKVGDWAVYNVETFIKTNASEEKIRETFGSRIINTIRYYEGINNTKIRLIIENKSPDGTVRFSITWFFVNGSSKKEMHEGNFLTGSGNLTLWIISPNVEKGEPVYTRNITYVPDAKSIIKRPFAGARREVVFTTFPLPAPEGFSSTTGIFWDRETGILCSMLTDTACVIKGIGIELRFRMTTTITETSLWSANENTFPTLQSIITILLFVSLLIVLLLKKRTRAKR